MGWIDLPWIRGLLNPGKPIGMLVGVKLLLVAAPAALSLHAWLSHDEGAGFSHAGPSLEPMQPTASRQFTVSGLHGPLVTTLESSLRCCMHRREQAPSPGSEAPFRGLPLYGGIADGARWKRVKPTTTWRSAMMDSTHTNVPSNCLGRTCLKWGADGELTALDLGLVMERLAQVDPDVAALYQSTSDCEPSASVS